MHELILEIINELNKKSIDEMSVIKISSIIELFLNQPEISIEDIFSLQMLIESIYVFEHYDELPVLLKNTIKELKLKLFRLGLEHLSNYKQLVDNITLKKPVKGTQLDEEIHEVEKYSDGTYSKRKVYGIYDENNIEELDTPLFNAYAQASINLYKKAEV